MTDRARRVAVVDLGHNGSLQRYLGALTQRRDLRGYYFATFVEAQHVFASGLDMASYLLEFEDNRRSNHPYVRALGLFELLFLAPERSVARLERGEEGPVPVYVAGDESRRMAVSSELQRGVRDFVADVMDALAGEAAAIPLSKRDAVHDFVSFASAPTFADAAMFADVSFVDAFGGHGRRHLLPSLPVTPLRGEAARKYVAQSWWADGARVIAGLKRDSVAAPFKLLPADLARKLRKLKRDPARFLADSKLPARGWIERVRRRFVP